MRETVKRLEPLLGFRVKVVENAGTSLGAALLSNKNPWAGSRFERPKCFPCQQNSRKVKDLKAANIVHESRCCLCNVEEKVKKENSLTDLRTFPSLYVGESSRSLHERSGEHHQD